MTTRFAAVWLACGALAALSGSGCGYRSLGSVGRDGEAAAAVDGRPGQRGGADASPTDAPGSGMGLGEADPGLPVQGRACLGAGDCASGHCVEGVCCDQACDRPCFSCKNALTASSPDGTCAAVASGKDDVRDRCGPAASAASCGNIGHCDGKGGCEKYGSTTVCAPAACASGSFTPAGTCDGAGNCSVPASQGCQGFTCTPAGGCASTCAKDADCTSGYCAQGGTCSAKKIDGAPCTASNECVHGNCVSGICCESACDRLCLACASASTGQAGGLCRPVIAGASSGGACAIDAAVCGQDGTCDGNGKCRFVIAGTSCGAPACASAQLIAAPVCNGAGTCATQAARTSCPGGVVCASDTACKPPSCAADADCASELCVSGGCAPKKGNGQGCAAARECQSGNCVDGVCCASRCSGACESCNAGTPGACEPVTGAPRAGHPACAGAGPCAGTCDGNSPACHYPGSGTVCSPASCSGNAAVLPASTCNGAGTCNPQAPMACSEGTTCSGGACIARLGTGAACQAAEQCASTNCSSGVCCPGGQTACGGTCFDLSTTQTHCGTCTNSCAATTQVCSGGRCLLTDKQPCTVDATCSSGICTPFFVDADGDTYGTTTTNRFCGITPPAGHSATGGDCCDSGGAVAARIRPNADFQNTSAGGVCGITWDYNCNRIVDKGATQCVGCSGFPMCTCMVSPFPDASCGQDVGFAFCTMTGTSCLSGGTRGILSCR